MRQCPSCGGLPHKGGVCQYGERSPKQWEHKDEWKRYGENFLVVVSRHAVNLSFEGNYDEGPHRWAVYAYIYPAHPIFKSFDGDAMYQDAATALPFHCGPSLLKWHIGKDGKPTSVQIGADYNHLHDSRFTRYATMQDAYEVFDDANRLHQHLESATTESLH